MSQYNASGHKAYKATAALVMGTIVKIASGEVVVATDANDKFIGVTAADVGAAELADVRLRSAQGTIKVRAGGNIAVGDYVTTDADGEAVATTTEGDEVLGMALEAGVDNDLVEVMPQLGRLAVPAA